METLTQCPVCNHTSFNSFLRCEDYLVSHQEFAIQSCSHCGFRFTNPRPNESDLGSYYKSDQYVSHNDKSGGAINIAYRTVRNYALRSKVNLITDLNKGKGSLLDVGCGTGAFLEKSQQAGWKVTGTEPDEDARTIASQKLQAQINPSLKAITNSSFDVITLWHVLEHIADLNDTIDQLYHLLSDKGSLVIAVPNSDSYDAHYFKQYWAAYDVPRHLHHFTPSTLVPLFENHRFKLFEKRPMIFDAFYIAMLSTRYQSGKTDYVKSIQLGLTSNSKARESGNWSSLIYVLRKA